MFSSVYTSELLCYPEFELDSDVLDEESLAHVEGTTRGYREQAMPLLVGLVDSASRRSLDTGLPLHQGNGHMDEDPDLEELAAKRIAGGGMIDSVANMANSILGAGNALVTGCPSG